MAPSAIPISSSELVNNGITKTISKTASSQTNGNIAPSLAQLPELDASLTTYTLTQNPKAVPSLDSPDVQTQRANTDHMLTAQWTLTTGWQAPEIKPFGPISLMPSASCLHYATECFEGMKLYRGYDGKLRLFRPDLNTKRMLMSSTRIALPGFNPDELLKLVVKLCELEGPKWLPKDRAGSFLYIRPTMISNDPTIGIQKPKEALLFIFLGVFPPVATGGMRLLASKNDMIRAWPGGFGWAKVGANYGPTLIAQGEARARGFDQILWLFGADGSVTEAGGSNFFVVWKKKDGKKQIVTAPLDDKIILDGVTRRSVLQIARERLSGLDEDIEVVERKFAITELEEAHNEGRLLECFASGTAFFISGVKEISFQDRTMLLPLQESGCGHFTFIIRKAMEDIMYGREKHDWAYILEGS